MKPKKPVQTGVQFQIDNEVTRCIRQHARAHMKTEVCGVLIGEQRGEVVEVQASIEALNAAQAGTHVTFTQDAWEEIYRVKDEKYPEHRIVGWYHSHPGFGVFLSEHDTFIHKNFFSAPNQVAWVYDPHTDEEGCFGWFDGKIERIATMAVVDLNGEGTERTPKERAHQEMPEAGFDDFELESRPAAKKDARKPRKGMPAWARIAVNVVSYVAVAVLGFLIALRLAPPLYLAVIADPRSGELIGIAIDPHTGEALKGSDGMPAMIVPLHLDQILHSQPSAHQPLGPTPEAPASQPAAQPQPKPEATPSVANPSAARPSAARPGGSK
jgi:proteasome lid subunit RPN8/RPN11